MALKLSSANLEKIKISFPPLMAVLMFVPLFVFRRIGSFDFWWWMSTDLVILCLFSLILDRSYRDTLRKELSSKLARNIFLGILSALLLYMIFYVGNEIIGRILPSSKKGIASVYGFKEGASVLRISLLMMFVIGPGEELFWRGYLQRTFQNKWGKAAGFFIATGLYTLVHIGSGNAILVLAAGLCGLYWGFLYQRFRSITLLMISHTLWDILIFIVRPV